MSESDEVFSGRVIAESKATGDWPKSRAEMADREAQARAVLTERVREAIEGIGDDGRERTVAAVAVGVFVEWLRNPPERVVQVDGSESVRCNAVGQYGDRCGYPLGHPSSHAALNAGGAPCIVWG